MLITNLEEIGYGSIYKMDASIESVGKKQDVINKMRKDGFIVRKVDATLHVTCVNLGDFKDFGVYEVRKNGQMAHVAIYERKKQHGTKV